MYQQLVYQQQRDNYGKRNGGVIGPANTPTSSVAAGVWRLKDAFNSIKNGTWPLTKAVATNSLRFNSGSSDYLSRSTGFSTTSTTKATFSAWLKRSYIGSNIKIFFGHYQSNSLRSAFVFDADVLRYYTDPSNVFVTNQVFRDSSAWYHVVLAIDTTQATAANRVRIYLNGTEITSFSSTSYPSQNATNFVPTFGTQTIGCNLLSGTPESYYYDGYLSEINFIDGQQLTPSSFGASNASGVWYPIAYQGTYGTTGFYLKFANSASLGTDSSGNGNNFTVNGGIASTSQSTDTEQNNFCTYNPLNNKSTSGSGTLTQGNLQVAYSGGQFQTNATFSPNKGKWFWETKGYQNMQQGTVGARIGFLVQDNTGYANQYFEGACIFGMWWHPTVGIYTCVGTTQTLRSSTLTYTDGDIIGIALDLDNNISYWYKNGTLTYTYDFSALSTIGSYGICPSLGNGSGSASPVFQCNFGSPMYSANGYTDGAGYGNFSYAVKSGHYALCTANLNTYG